jgi:plastocyanin
MLTARCAASRCAGRMGRKRRSKPGWCWIVPVKPGGGSHRRRRLLRSDPTNCLPVWSKAVSCPNQKTIMKKVILLTALLIGGVSAAWSADHKVRVSDFRFTPKTVNAVVGDTITWRWQNGMHTTTSLSIPSGARPWNAPIDSTHAMFRTRLRVAGTYSYQCNFHFAQGMTGTIVVSAASSGQVPATH